MQRDHVSVLADVLRAVDDIGGTPKQNMTRLAARANVAFDRLQSYITDLERLGLLSEGDWFRVTDHGYDFIVEHARWTRILKDLGVLNGEGAREVAPRQGRSATEPWP